MQPDTQKKKIIIPIAVVALLLFGLLAAYVIQGDGSEATTVNNSQTTEQAAQQPAEGQSNSEFKDGTYSAAGSYTSPGGSEEITVSVTLQDGVIADSSVTAMAVNPNSKSYQARFIGGYKSQVTGKSLAELQVGAVAGSSLTPQGFNDALAKIKTQAAS